MPSTTALCRAGSSCCGEVDYTITQVVTVVGILPNDFCRQVVREWWTPLCSYNFVWPVWDVVIICADRLLLYRMTYCHRPAYRTPTALVCSLRLPWCLSISQCQWRPTYRTGQTPTRSLRTQHHQFDRVHRWFPECDRGVLKQSVKTIAIKFSGFIWSRSATLWKRSRRLSMVFVVSSVANLAFAFGLYSNVFRSSVWISDLPPHLFTFYKTVPVFIASHLFSSSF